VKVHDPFCLRGREVLERIASWPNDDDNRVRPWMRVGPVDGVQCDEARLFRNPAVPWGKSLAGYSRTPLAKKLGIKPGMILRVVNAPGNYAALVAPLPERVVISPNSEQELDMVHVFTRSRSELLELLKAFQRKIKQDGIIWVSWPKKSSGVPSEVTEDTIRDVALPLGLVDIKVCAVDETWSGLKLVIRVENRR
jgi:hypothetical protein